MLELGLKQFMDLIDCVGATVEIPHYDKTDQGTFMP